MDNVQFYVLATLGGITTILGILLLVKIKNVTYLLEQPVVKKLSPAVKLKPVKVDEIDDQSRRAPERNAANGSPVNRPAGRPVDAERPDRGPRDQSRDRAPRGDREMGDRGPRSDRGGDRGDRFGGGRDRGDRNGRHDRHDRHGGDRNRGPRPDGVFSNEREAAPLAEGGAPAPRPAPAPRDEMRPRGEDFRRNEAPRHDSGEPALAPRRPLPSTVDAETETKELAAPETSANAPLNDASVSDPMFGQTDSDIQHGRRNQLKKKPRFEVADEEAKETTEESKV
jgi:hypothetical protein